MMWKVLLLLACVASSAIVYCDDSSDFDGSETVDVGGAAESVSDSLETSSPQEYSSTYGKVPRPTPTYQCGPNEVFSNCTNGGCDARYCSQAGKPVPCVKLDPKNCKKGCVCAPGYLRTVKGNCVPRNKCNEGCGNDPNSHPGCGINCGRTCATYKQKNVACILLCYDNGCDCNDGWVYDPNVKKCVKPKDCTPTCGLNEQYSSCTNGGCGHRNCSQIGKPQICIDRTPESCTKGCICAEGYLRLNNGTCVPENQCPATGCGGDPNAQRGCGYNCRKKCSDYKSKNPYLCPRLQCKPDKCDCKDGYVLDENLKKCVRPEKCTPVCGLNEKYTSCINGGCGHRNCSQLGQPILCIDPIPGACKPGCLCADGYLRDDNGKCVPQKECPNTKGCGGDPNSKPGCGVNCGKTCDTYKVKNPICPRICRINGCDCVDGYIYDNYVKKCVKPEDCTPTCDKPNEVYDKCPAPCPPRRCDVDDRVIRCAAPPKPGDAACRPGCRCEDGYARNATGTCVLREQCEQPLECNYEDNEEYDSCPAPCPGDSCDVDPAAVLCLPGPQYGDPQCKPACRCLDGYARNSDNKCVPRNQCPPKTDDQCPGQNEFYDTCISGCSNQSCNSIGKVIHCPIQPAVCREGCRCKKGFYKNADNVCVAASECRPVVTTTLTPVIIDTTTTEKPTTDSGDNEALAKLKTGVTIFNGKFLYDCMKGNKGKNLITSPYSVITPLVQMLMFASGNTLKQLTTALNVESKQQVRSAYPALVASLAEQTSVNFSTAAIVYSDIKYPLSDAFKKVSVDLVRAGAQELEFSKNIEAAKTVNTWVERQTNNLIHNLIQPSDLSELTRIVLVNAIYFKGDWQYSFNKNLTIKNADFYLSDGTTKKTSLMYQERRFKYGEVPELDCKVLQMFYKGENFSMVIVLPNQKDGILPVAEKLQLQPNFEKVMNSMRSQIVKVYVPPFKIETTTDLSGILKQMGITDIFNSNNSGLSGMLKNPHDIIYVSKAIQKAFIEVNEEGTEAAAANGVIVSTRAIPLPPPEPIVFKADRPFLFYIRLHDTTMFSGVKSDI